MQYGRVSLPRPDGYSADQRVYEIIVGGPRSKDAGTLPRTDIDGRLYGPFMLRLAHPRIADIVHMLGAAMRCEPDLAPQDGEIATLAVAAGKRSNFEWFAHEHLGLRAGLTTDELDHLMAVEPALSLDAYDDLIWRVVTAWWTLLSRSLRVWRTPLPDGPLETVPDA
jgi:hypothetical protein